MGITIIPITASRNVPMEQSSFCICKVVDAKACAQLAQLHRHTASLAKTIQTISNFLRTRDNAYLRAPYILIWWEINAIPAALVAIIVQLIRASTAMPISTATKTNATRIAIQLACSLTQVCLLMAKKYVYCVQVVVIHAQESCAKVVWPITLSKIAHACRFVWF